MKPEKDKKGIPLPPRNDDEELAAIDPMLSLMSPAMQYAHQLHRKHTKMAEDNRRKGQDES